MKQILSKYKKTILLSTFIVLLPTLYGLSHWDELPDRMITHWGISGNADGWSEKPSAIFMLPAIFIIVHIICILATAADKRNRTQDRRVIMLAFWITPAISVITGVLFYSSNMGARIDTNMLAGMIFGIIMIVFGYLMPRTKPNSTIGIRIPSTFRDEDNWRATHLLAGKTCTAGGLAVFAFSLLDKSSVIAVSLVTLAVVTIIPIIYSIRFERLKNK